MPPAATNITSHSAHPFCLAIAGKDAKATLPPSHYAECISGDGFHTSRYVLYDTTSSQALSLWQVCLPLPYGKFN